MPSEPVWFNRLPSILEELRALDSDYLDRHAIELIFGVRERRARQLMAGLSTLRVGNAVAVRRRTLIARLETSLADGAHNAGSAPALELTAAPELRPSAQRGKILMASNGKSEPGESGNPATQLMPGNSHRWQPGQSGKPAGIARSRLEFDDSFYETLLGDRSADEVANLLWEAVQKGEPWAFQSLQRLARDAKQIKVTHVRRKGTAMKLANDPVVPAPGAGDPGGNSRATDRPATAAVDTLTAAAHDAKTDSSRRVSLKQHYDEFCLAKVKDHVRALPEAIRSQRFEEARSAIRRAVPQLRRNELDEMAQRELESKIRAELRLPSIEEFARATIRR